MGCVCVCISHLIHLWMDGDGLLSYPGFVNNASINIGLHICFKKKKKRPSDSLRPFSKVFVVLGLVVSKRLRSMTGVGRVAVEARVCRRPDHLGQKAWQGAARSTGLCLGTCGPEGPAQVTCAPTWLVVSSHPAPTFLALIRHT